MKDTAQASWADRRIGWTRVIVATGAERCVQHVPVGKIINAELFELVIFFCLRSLNRYTVTL